MANCYALEVERGDIRSQEYPLVVRVHRYYNQRERNEAVNGQWPDWLRVAASDALVKRACVIANGHSGQRAWPVRLRVAHAYAPPQWLPGA